MRIIGTIVITQLKQLIQEDNCNSNNNAKDKYMIKVVRKS